jgi:hypothetical protein
MEPRKRPHVEEENTVSAKKRVLSDTNGSPHVNGVLDQEEPAEGDNIEVMSVCFILSISPTLMLLSSFARRLSFVE